MLTSRGVCRSVLQRVGKRLSGCPDQRHSQLFVGGVRASSFQATTTATSISSTSYTSRYYSTDNHMEEALGPNPGLESIISQGLPSLESTAADVHGKTKTIRLSVEATGANAASRQQPNPRQLAEADRILDMATECLEDLCERQQGKLHLGGEPIVILDVHVNGNAKQAKVFWTLPYSVLTDSRMTAKIYQKLMTKMQDHVVGAGGGEKLLARQVHSRLRSYYPPRLKMRPATTDMVAQAMSEYLGDGDEF